MIEREVDNLIYILKNAKKAINEEDIILLKELSNRTIHTASMYKDVDSVMVAITIYALSKLVERKKYEQYKDWDSFFRLCLKNIESASQALKQNRIRDFRESLIEIRTAANKLSPHLKKYIQDIFRKASINKASRIYEHGTSLGETANLLGISSWELAEYSGMTGIGDVDLSITMPIKERIKFTRDLFEK